MALLEKQLYVQRSQLPNSGKGLFTSKFIKKGTRIVEYKGELKTWKEVKNDDGENGYIFYISNKVVIDALPSTNTLGRYANDAKGLIRIKGLKNNCEYVVDGNKCFIEAAKDLYPDDEIFVGYGKEYWQIVQDNMEIDEAEEEEEEEEDTKKKKNKKKKKKGKSGHKKSKKSKKK